MPYALSGRELAKNVRQELAQLISKLPARPALGVVLVGSDPASHLYVKLKTEAAKEIGVNVERTDMPDTANTAEVIRAVRAYNQRSDINGILVQLPLPAQIDEGLVIQAIDPAKDADGFHSKNLAALARNEPGIVPGVSQGIMRLIQSAQVPLSGKAALLLVNSEEFAAPLKLLLEQHKVSCRTNNRVDEAELANADIIVSALGKPAAVPARLMKDGAIGIDVGTSKVGDKVVGDIDADGTDKRRLYLSPVPGGVGPMTVAMLLMNVYRLAAKDKPTVY